MKTIPLTKGQFAIVNDEDYERLAQHKWYASGKAPKYYAARDVIVDGVKSCIYMHREIMNAPPELDVDHIHGNTLDNRRLELRLATESQNEGNRLSRNKNNTTGYMGVICDKRRNTFSARIESDGELYISGSYLTPGAAALEYDRLAQELRGQHTYLNYPNERGVMKHICIEVTEKGEVSIEAVGFKGPSCEAATKAFEEAIGTVTKKRKLPEYAQTANVVQNQRIAS